MFFSYIRVETRARRAPAFRDHVFGGVAELIFQLGLGRAAFLWQGAATPVGTLPSTKLLEVFFWRHSILPGTERKLNLLEAETDDESRPSTRSETPR